MAATRLPGPGGSTTDLIVERLERHRNRIVQRLIAKLHESHSPLAARTSTHMQVRAHAMQVMGDIITYLRGGDPADPDNDRLAVEIGAARARDQVPPDASLTAAQLLGETIYEVVVPDLTDTPDPAEATARLTHARDVAISRRLCLASRSYMTFINNQLQDGTVEMFATKLHKLGATVSAAGRADTDALSAQRPNADPLAEPHHRPAPSERERQVLELAAEGLTNRQIASELSITKGTVKRHLSTVFSKFGVNSRVEAINYAIEAGLITRDR